MGCGFSVRVRWKKIYEDMSCGIIRFTNRALSLLLSHFWTC